MATKNRLLYIFKYMTENGAIETIKGEVEDSEEAHEEVIDYCRMNNIKVGECVIKRYKAGSTFIGDLEDYDGFSVFVP